MKMNKIKFPCLIALTLMALLSCHGKGKEVEIKKEVDTAKAFVEDITKTVLFTGSIDAEDFAQIYPRVPGKVIKKILKEGDEVKKEQAIALTRRDEVGFTYKPGRIVSPIDGVVGQIMVDVGTNVDLSTPVAVVVRPGNMRVKIDVPEQYLNVIKVGAKATMNVHHIADKKFEGEITVLSPVVDAHNRTARVEIKVPNPDGLLKHGMFARIDLPVETKKDALVVAKGAISWEGEKQFVYKIVDDRAKRTEIKVGIRNDEHIEVLEGLSSGDEVVIGNLIDITDGEAVAAKNGTL